MMETNIANNPKNVISKADFFNFGGYKITGHEFWREKIPANVKIDIAKILLGLSDEFKINFPNNISSNILKALEKEGVKNADEYHVNSNAYFSVIEMLKYQTSAEYAFLGKQSLENFASFPPREYEESLRKITGDLIVAKEVGRGLTNAIEHFGGYKTVDLNGKKYFDLDTYKFRDKVLYQSNVFNVYDIHLHTFLNRNSLGDIAFGLDIYGSLSEPNFMVTASRGTYGSEEGLWEGIIWRKNEGEKDHVEGWLTLEEGIKFLENVNKT